MAHLAPAEAGHDASQPAPPGEGESRLGRGAGGDVAGRTDPGCGSVRVLVVFLKVLLVHVRVLMGGAVVAVLVLMFHVLVVMKDMSVRVRHVTVLVFMAVWCLGHVPLRPD